MNHLLLSFRIAALLTAAAGLMVSNANADQAADRASIETQVQTYTEAFNSGDAGALAGCWAPDAIYIVPDTGKQIEGRSEIKEHFAKLLLQHKGSKLKVDVESIRFISPHVAAEQGKTTLVSADGQADQSRYTAIHVKQDGKWYLDRVTETEAKTTPSQYEHLKELEWLIGSWTDQDEQSSIEMTSRWTKNQTFITRSFAASEGDQIVLSGMQLIGYDAVKEEIRSWTFDSDGGFNEGRWSKLKNGWTVTSSGSTADGRKTSSLNTFSDIGENEYKWKSTSRMAAGQLLSNIDEVVVVRSSH